VSRKPPFQIQIVPLPTSSAPPAERKLITDIGEQKFSLAFCSLYKLLLMVLEDRMRGRTRKGTKAAA